MIDFVRIDGTAVRVTNLTRRSVEGDDGGALREVTLVVIVYGEQAHEALCRLLAPRTLRLDIPEESGPESFAVEVASADYKTFGQGETTAYRHEVTLRERTRAAAGMKSEVEEIPVAVRLEALIEALDEAGVVSRGRVEEIAWRLRRELGTR